MTDTQYLEFGSIAGCVWEDGARVPEERICCDKSRPKLVKKNYEQEKAIHRSEADEKSGQNLTERQIKIIPIREKDKHRDKNR